MSAGRHAGHAGYAQRTDHPEQQQTGRKQEKGMTRSTAFRAARIREHAFALGLLLACVLAAAHWWRAGSSGAALFCLLWGLACLWRAAWMRPVSVMLLGGMTICWGLTAAELIQLRLLRELPWARLAAILAGVGLFTLWMALLAWGRMGRRWFVRGQESRTMQLAAFLLTLAVLLPLPILAPYLLLSERLLPGSGLLQVGASALWGGLVCGWLHDRRRAAVWRRRVWLLFSLVFFGQFALAAAGHTVFYMTGEPHIPVPGVIIGGALYRGEAGFMLVLLLVSVLLAGSAWCSHLCYFGSWDALAASSSRPLPHAHPLRWRVLALALTCGTALGLRCSGAPLVWAVTGGILLGLLLVPVALFWSRRRGYAVYCTMICPLGLLVCLLGRCAPWRIRRTEQCVLCGACTRACRYGALDMARLLKGQPGPSCTLCRDCLTACPRGGLGMSWAGMGLAGRGEQVFVTLMAAMHAIFLCTAMV